jgi:hypothetical protein
VAVLDEGESARDEAGNRLRRGVPAKPEVRNVRRKGPLHVKARAVPVASVRLVAERADLVDRNSSQR